MFGIALLYPTVIGITIKGCFSLYSKKFLVYCYIYTVLSTGTLALRSPTPAGQVVKLDGPPQLSTRYTFSGDSVPFYLRN